jgi:O-antigen ligase
VSSAHYAGFVELGALVTLGLFLAILTRPTGRLDWAGIRAAVVDRDWALPRLIVLGIMSILAACGLLIAGSEGGYLALGAGLVFLFLAKRSGGGLLVVLAGAVVIVGVAVGLVSVLGPGVQDLESVPLATSEISPSYLLRLDSWAKTLELFSDFPVAGTGLGTYEWGFAAYQREGDWLTWADAHNDYLQLVAEAGLVGAGLLAWALWIFIQRVMRPAVGGASARTRWTSAATAAAVFAMLFHSIGDFNLQTPSNAVLFSVLVGVLVAASGDRESRRART